MCCLPCGHDLNYDNAVRSACQKHQAQLANRGVAAVQFKTFTFSRQVAEPPARRLRNVSTEVKYVELELSPHWVAPPQHHLTWAQQYPGYPNAQGAGAAQGQGFGQGYGQGQFGLAAELQGQNQAYGLGAEGIRDNSSWRA